MNAHWLWAWLPLVAVLAGAAGAAQREVKQAFPVRPGCLLAIDTHRGAVAIEESDASEIRVRVIVDTAAETEAAAQRMLDDISVDLNRNGNGVAIRARSRRESGVSFDWKEEERADLIYRISVPRQCSVDLKARDGSFTVGNLSGKMVARIEQGTIFFRRIEGSIDAQIESGDLVVSRCTGSVTARVRRGAIRLGPIGGLADLKSSNGDIEVMTVETGVIASTEAGDITVSFAPKISVESRLTVSGGNILAHVHREAACRIEATTTWGHVQSTLPLKIESGENGARKLVGQLNAGGPLLRLRASGGSIKLDPQVVLLDVP